MTTQNAARECKSAIKNVAIGHRPTKQHFVELARLNDNGTLEPGRFKMMVEILRGNYEIEVDNVEVLELIGDAHAHR